MSLLHRFLRFFFWHFYHGFAWTYDFVASVVSIGRWNDWIRSVLPYVKGDRVLEIGHGPGHLQRDLRRQPGRLVIGLDESPQMGRIARKRLEDAGFDDAALTRGVGQQLPFVGRTFDTVVATFPTEYIFEAGTMEEVLRVLQDDGRFIVVPAAWIVGRKALDRVAAWLFRATDQAPRFPADILAERLRAKFEQAGFSTRFVTARVRSSEVLIIVAEVSSLRGGITSDATEAS